MAVPAVESPAVTTWAPGSTELMAALVRLEHGRVGGGIGAGSPEAPEVGLVPDLPGPDGQGRDLRVLGPEPPVRAVAAHQRPGEVREIGVAAGWVDAGGARRRARGPLRRVEEDREDADPAARQLAHPRVIAREVEAAGTSLDPRPLELLAQRPHAQAVELGEHPGEPAGRPPERLGGHDAEERRPDAGVGRGGRRDLHGPRSCGWCGASAPERRARAPSARRSRRASGEMREKT